MGTFHSLAAWFRLPRRDTPLAFVHLYKTAGTSVNLFLTNRFPAGQCCRLYPEHGETYRDRLPRRAKLCYSGHLRFDEMRAIAPRGSCMLTTLRDPVERALSAYYGCRRQPREVLARRGPEYLPTLDMSLPEMVRTHRLLCVRLFGNFQTDYLSRPGEVGRVEDGSFLPPTRTDLARARDNLARCLVGTTERLDELLTLLCLERGWPAPDQAPSANRNPQRPRVPDLDRETVAFLEEHTALDAELHRFAGELLKERWDRVRPEAEVKRPRSRECQVTFDGAIPGHGWHQREKVEGDHFCFSGPRAWLVCPAPSGREIQVEVETLTLLPDEHDGPFTLRVNGREVALTRVPTPTGKTYRGVVPGGLDGGEARLDFESRNPVRPHDVLPNSEDRRLVGPAVTAVRLRAA